MRNEHDVHYCVYRGDEILCHGTKSEVTSALDITESTLDWLTTPTALHRANRANGNRMIAVKTILANED